MKINRVQVVLACVAILGVAILAEVMQPRELMARTAASPSLEDVIPKQFGTWTLVPEISPVKPNEEYVLDPTTERKNYSQEVGRGYSDGRGNIVMLLVAYGPVQNYRLKSHRPEICYTANGFRISEKTEAAVSYRDGTPPISTMRLITQRESRYEPVTYWMRVGNDISNGVVGHQLSRLKYGLRGVIPDGALIRISTIGLPREASFKLQDQFIRDLLAAVPAKELKFFTGAS
ncbi:exosortase-associated protein EpsI, V-type [Bradyrhizobium lablabi]|uniref:exosortase-associated protein EpsI, V-type n=1 Tax=Bradyrhizobium lablabi TaxID=722472 RepID=UPI001BA48D6F|nr:exosortase-associated protein EpsI, V-type [Bradyrhizobium lablabi]MBR0697793.1 EpsI family protein [Bradyrhizobium lablabi]